MQQFADPAGQAWLQLWVGLFAKQGGTSRLARYVRDDEHRDEPVQHGRAQTGPEAARLRRGQPGQAKVEDFQGEQKEDEETVTILNRASLAQVLEEAPVFFRSVRALRRHLPEDYDLFRRIGCVLVPHDDTALYLASGQIETYPSFVATIWPGKWWNHPDWQGKEAERDRKTSIQIYKRVRYGGAYLQWGDIVYEWLHIAGDLSTGRSGGEAAYIGVDSATGKARVLAQPTVTPQRLRYGTVTHTHVGVPKWVREWHRDDHLMHGSLHEWVSSVLSLSLSLWRSADNGWQVHLTDRPEPGQQPVTMRLCIPERSAKAFFRDREAPEEGRLRPIFHLVGEHERRLGDNRSTTVRQHYRGNRAFTWNGYQTLITVPGHHHNALSTMDWDMVDDAELKERGISPGELGRRLAAYVRRASPLHSYKRGY